MWTLLTFMSQIIKAIVFSVPLSPPTGEPCATVLLRVLNADSACEAFSNTLNSSSFMQQQCWDALDNSFNTACLPIIDHIAPLKIRKKKHNPSPWLSEHTRALKRQCRKDERIWKANRLQVSFDILRSHMVNYQTAVKEARSAYFSSLISSNSHNSKVLFKVIDSTFCEQFLLL